MIRRLVWNDMKNKPLFAISTFLITAITTMLFALSVLLLSQLLSSMDTLMAKAKTPDFLQMHVGEMDRAELEAFNEAHPEIDAWHIQNFLNLNNATLGFSHKDSGRENSLSESTQDNGLVTQAEGFDYLLTLENEMAQAEPGEVFVPVAYRSLYDVKEGDTLQIGTEKLTVAGFIRDSQMNAMMASSKRFLVSQEDYERLETLGETEYLIGYRLEANADVNAFATAYAEAGLPANGPTITRPLIRMMNALSDGMMIMVIVLVAIAVLVVALLCLHFIIGIQMEKDRREVGLLKAIGTSRKDIKKIYFAKYLLLAGTGGVAGVGAAGLLQAALARS